MKKTLLVLASLLFLIPSVSSASTLTQAQVSAIIGVLQAFGADIGVIQSVEVALAPSAPETSITQAPPQVVYGSVTPVEPTQPTTPTAPVVAKSTCITPTLTLTNETNGTAPYDNIFRSYYYSNCIRPSTDTYSFTLSFNGKNYSGSGTLNGKNIHGNEPTGPTYDINGLTSSDGVNYGNDYQLVLANFVSDSSTTPYSFTMTIGSTTASISQ